MQNFSSASLQLWLPGVVLPVRLAAQHLGPGQQRGQPAAVVGGGGGVPAAGHQDQHAGVGAAEVAGGIVDI